MENLLIPYLLKVVILGRILENLPKVVLENGGIKVEMKELKMKMKHLLGISVITLEKTLM